MRDPIETLNDLIATCRDSEEGFGKAAKGVHDDHLRVRLIGIARERADFADELAAQVTQLGGRPAESGHQSGIQHRGWRELEETIRPKKNSALLANCEAGEENTLHHYERALGENLPEAVRPIVERQRVGIETALLELRNLEQVRKAG